MSDLVTALLLAGYPVLAMLAGRALWSGRRSAPATARDARRSPGPPRD